MSHLAAVLLPSVLLLWQGGKAAASPPAPEQIERAVRELGHDAFAVRERASDFLWKAGKAAEPALIEAAASNDAEVAARARRILRSFNYGIYPDTPDEVVELISRFRYGNQSTRHAVLKQLIQMGRTSTLLKLLKMEPDERVRKQLTDGLVKDLDKIAGQLFVAGDWARVEQLLELGAVHDTGMRNYAAYLLVRGQLDAKIAQSRARLGGPSQTLDAHLLAHLLRAKGDLNGAREAARTAADPDLTTGILFELGDWKELAVLHDKAGEDPNNPFARGIVQYGYAAAYHRLAGNHERYDEAVADVKKLAERKPNKLWYCAETLLIIGRFQDAVELVREERPTAAFDILALQSRFREALELAHVEDPRGPYLPWFDPESKSQTGSTQKAGRFAMGLRVASTLYRLGEKEQSLRLFSELADEAEADRNLSMRSVCQAEYNLGLSDQAFEHAAVVLSEGPDTAVLRTLFPEHHAAAATCWKHFRNQYRNEQPDRTLGRLRKLFEFSPAENTAGDDWERLVEQAEPAARESPPEDRGRWLAALGEMCLARGRPRMAEEYFTKAVEAAPTATSMLRLADVLAEDAQWQKAAEWYQQAWEKDPAKPTALYLQGRTLVRAGQEPEGRKLLQAARLLPLGNAQTRYEFAKNLQDRGLSDEAVRQWEVTIRTGEFRSWEVNEAARQLGNLASGTEDLKAAAYWERPLLKCLQTSTAILGVEGYLKMVHLIHKARAKGLLAAGKLPEALEQVRLSHAALPGETRLALELIPGLEKAGLDAGADELFAEVFAVGERVCADFPQSSMHHNNLAWLAARSRRQLDKALEYANRAVALDPQKPIYIDTLAEVHFRRGDRQKAVELAQRCVQLAPQEEHYREQLKRFKSP